MSLFPAFWSGIKYGFNPLSIIIILIFILFLSYIGKTKKRVITIGLSFSSAVLLTAFLLPLGLFDKFLDIPAFHTIAGILYSIISGVFIIFGFLYLIDWGKYQKNKTTAGFLSKEAAFLKDPKYIREKFMTKFFFIFLSVFLGFFLTLFASLWPQDEYFLILFSFFMAGNDWKFAMLSFVIYSMAFIVPLIIVWVGIIWILFSPKVRTILAKAVSQRKIISSAVFLSTGFGLGYVVLQILM